MADKKFTDQIVEYYAKDSVNNIPQMRVQALRYYQECMARFQAGERFYPFGLLEGQWIHVLSRVKSAIATLTIKADGSLRDKFWLDCVREIHFSMCFKVIHVSRVDLSVPHYFFDTGSYVNGNSVYLVIRIEERFNQKRKERHVILHDGSSRHLEGGGTISRKLSSLPFTQRLEKSIPERYIPNDHDMIFKRMQRTPLDKFLFFI